MWDPWVQSLGWEKGMATHSSILAWRIPWKRAWQANSPWGHKESDTSEQLSLFKKKQLEQRLPLAGGDGGRLRRGWERERTWWREGNVCGWRLVYTGACIGQNSAIVQLMLMRCALVNFTFKEKKHVSQYWTLVNDLHAEIVKGDVTWRQLVF